ncbi:hypothetical protein QNO07_13030 [Streptomyces sp. 549]|uniref:hypothetical protein n=1 Tax=Streptomyces sp. 549 TaxID=3049076 RepID=UPI0024C3AB8A|nr:hypothetical protein [Streptomyces sp. 549]MDK1474334.1 hypothetical protein [Streptomyces sp. 549]
MPDFLTDRRQAWVITVIGTALLAGVVIELVIGECLDVLLLALGLLLLPQGLSQLARSHQRPDLLRKARILSAVGAVAAGLTVWTWLVLGWVNGDGTDWWVFAAALLLLAAGVLALAGVVASRRSEGPGGSGRMGA